MHTILVEKFYLCKQNQEGMKEDQKIVIYQTEDGQTQIDVRLENDTVWLTQAQMVELFQTTKQNVSLHLNNLYKEGELEKELLCLQLEKLPMSAGHALEMVSFC